MEDYSYRKKGKTSEKDAGKEGEKGSLRAQLYEANKPRPLFKKDTGIYQDCEFYRIPDPNGRKGYKTISIYKGLYYEIGQTGKERKKYILKFLALFAAALLVFLFCAAQPIAANRSWVGIAEGFAFVMIVYVAMEIIINLTAEKQMREYLYKQVHNRLIRSCEFAMIMNILCTGCSILYLLLDSSAVSQQVMCILGFAITAIAFHFLAKMEEAVPYRHYLSQDVAPEYAEKIIYDTTK